MKDNNVLDDQPYRDPQKEMPNLPIKELKAIEGPLKVDWKPFFAGSRTTNGGVFSLVQKDEDIFIKSY